jgi:hypothetical protein
MAKSNRLVPKNLADEATRRYLQDLRDDLETMTKISMEVMEMKASDGEVVTVAGKGATPLIDGFSLSVTESGENIRIKITTGTPGKKTVRFLIVK